jgi:hypothetical protein
LLLGFASLRVLGGSSEFFLLGFLFKSRGCWHEQVVDDFFKFISGYSVVQVDERFLIGPTTLQHVAGIQLFWRPHFFKSLGFSGVDFLDIHQMLGGSDWRLLINEQIDAFRQRAPLACHLS